MELTKQAIEQIQSEVGQAIDNRQKEFAVAGVDTAICANKDLILGFLKTLVALLPGPIGKIVGQIVLAAAETWFSKKCPA